MSENIILTIIAATTLTEGHDCAFEFDDFIKSTNKLKHAGVLDPLLSEAKLLAWFEMNKGNVREKLSAEHFKGWFSDQLRQLKDMPQKEDIMKVIRMKVIRKAD